MKSFRPNIESETSEVTSVTPQWSPESQRLGLPPEREGRREYSPVSGDWLYQENLCERRTGVSTYTGVQKERLNIRNCGDFMDRQGY